MGLLDQYQVPGFMPDPNADRNALITGLLAGGFGLLTGNRNQPWNAVGRGGLAGLAGYAAANQLNQSNDMKNMEMAMQVQKWKEAQAERERSLGFQNAYAQTLSPEDQAAFNVNPTLFLTERNKRYTVGDNLVTGGGQQLFAAPQKQQLVDVPVPGQPGVTQKQWITPGQGSGVNVGGEAKPDILNPEVFNARKDLAAAGATKVSVPVSMSTEKKYGEQFAGKIAEQDSAMLDAARGAPELARRANQVKEIISSGNVATGWGADYKLNFGKAAAAAGFKGAEDYAANTEVLAGNLAKNTLDAIKASGLGSGSGFSNADRDFLEKAVGGKITLEAKSLDRLADLAHRAASQSAAKWNTRSQEIPDSALDGTGVKRTPVEVPALYTPKRRTSDYGNAPQVGTEKDGYRFKGGNPADPKSWEKL